MCEFVFNKECDLYEVDQFGFVNLREAYVSGVVEGSAPVSADAFNEAPYDSMMNRPDDIFAQSRQQNYVRDTLRSIAASEAPSE